MLVGPSKRLKQIIQIEPKSQLARGKPAGNLQAWPRIWTQDYRELIQLTIRAGLELGASKLQVQRSNHKATPPPVSAEIPYWLHVTTTTQISVVLLIGRAAWSVWNVSARFSDVMWQGYQYSFLDTYINVKNDYLDEMNELEFNLQNHRQRFQVSITGRILDFLTWVPDSKA